MCTPKDELTNRVIIIPNNNCYPTLHHPVRPSLQHNSQNTMYSITASNTFKLAPPEQIFVMMKNDVIKASTK